MESDTQRRLAAIALGSTIRELGSGLLAAAAAAIPVIVLALVLPWVLNGITGPQHIGDPPLIAGIARGIWAHLLLVPPAVAIGAWASRAVTRTAGTGVTMLAAGTVAVLVLGLNGSPAPWLVPPAMAVARHAASGGTWLATVGITFWALIWTGAVLGGYTALRRKRN